MFKSSYTFTCGGDLTHRTIIEVREGGSAVRVDDTPEKVHDVYASLPSVTEWCPMDRFTELRDVLGKSASAHDYLKRYAIEGRLRPGRRLIPSDLEKHFGISATPIRDALVRLAAEGFLTWEPSHGFFSKPFSLEEQCDLNHILIIAIPACWDRSGGSSPTMVLEAAIAFQDRFAASADAESETQAQTWNEAVEHLFAVAADATHNDVLREVSHNATERTRFVRLFDLERPETRRLVADQIAAGVRAQNAFEGCAVGNEAFASLRARLPTLVAQANAHAFRSSFP